MNILDVTINMYYKGLSKVLLVFKYKIKIHVNVC